MTTRSGLVTEEMAMDQVVARLSEVISSQRHGA